MFVYGYRIVEKGKKLYFRTYVHILQHFKNTMEITQMYKENFFISVFLQIFEKKNFLSKNVEALESIFMIKKGSFDTHNGIVFNICVIWQMS